MIDNAEDLSEQNLPEALVSLANKINKEVRAKNRKLQQPNERRCIKPLSSTVAKPRKSGGCMAH